MTDEREHEEKDTLPQDNVYYIAPSMGAHVQVVVNEELAKEYQLHVEGCGFLSRIVSNTIVFGIVSEVNSTWHVALGDEKITLVDEECLVDIASSDFPDGGTGFIAVRHIQGLTPWNLEDYPNHEVIARPGL